MVNFNCSINRKLINKGNPQLNGWNNVNISTDELSEIIKNGFAFSPGVIKSDMNRPGKKPKMEDIEYAEIIAIDVDNTIKVNDPITNEKIERCKTIEEGYFSFDEAAADAWLNKNAMLIYTTCSHTDDINKFRIVFLLPNKINNSIKYTEFIKHFITKFGGDPACSNIDRLFFGNTNAIVHIFDAKLSDKELDRIVNQSKHELSEYKYFNSMSINNEITEESCKDMLKYIPGDSLDYNDWGKIVSAIGNHFDEATAIRLVDNWSPDKHKGTRYKIVHRSKKPSIASVIYFAEQYGFDKKKFYSSFKSNTQINNIGNFVNKDGSPSTPIIKTENNAKNQIAAIEEYFNEYYELRYNQITSQTEFKLKNTESEWDDVNDRFVNEVWRQFALSRFVGKKEIPINKFNNVLDSHFVQSYHPFKSYIYNNEKWDGHDHIGDFIKRVRVIDEHKGIWKLYFLRWWIGVIACMTERGLNHCCIVLSGEQSIGKTSLIRLLIPQELKKYYTETQINPKDKDSLIIIAESFLTNLDELESINRDEIGYLKSLMTMNTTRTRRSYGRRFKTIQRHTSFIGSVNRAMFLTDMTGNRRFLVVEALEIDYKSPVNINQMFAQALEMLNDGVPYWFSGDDVKLINEHNKQYQIVSAEEELIIKYFDAPDTDGLTNDEIIHYCNAGKWVLMNTTEILDYIQKETSNRLSIYKLGQILKRLGFKQIRTIKEIIGMVKNPYRRYILQKLKTDNYNNEIEYDNAVNF